MKPNSPKLMNSPEEIVIEIFKSMFPENEQEELVNVAKNDFELRIFGFPISVSDSIPTESINIRIGDDYNGDPPDKHPEPGLFDQDEYEVITLGSYTPMQSPGKITFYQKNISRYSGLLIRKVVDNDIVYCLETILYTIFYVVDNIWEHEGFHYYCDYKRQFTKSVFNRNLEEAFAIAHSYLKEMRQHHRIDSFKRMYFEKFIGLRYDRHKNGDWDHWINTRIEQLRRYFRHEHFNSFTLPGYRDWNHFNNRHVYSTHIYNYLKNNFLDDLLIKNNIPVNDLIESEIYRLGNNGAQIYLV